MPSNGWKRRIGWMLARVLATGLVLALLGGCVTAREVEQIVADANRQGIVAGIAGGGATLDPAPGDAAGDGWEQAVARIEAYIVDHPDQPRTNNALRVREAVLLLNARQPNLARAVFDQVDRSQLAGARDLAIYDTREHLVWWYGLGPAMTPDDRRSARDAMTGLADVADGLARSSYTRRFLEETRVRVGLRLAASLSDPDDVRAVLDAATARYAAQFDDADRRAIQAWHGDRALGEGATLESLRWFDYVPTAFARADEIGSAACPGDCPDYTPAWVACIAAGSC